MSEQEHNQENQQYEVNPYEIRNPRTGAMETSNWSFGGWTEEEKKD